MQEEKAGASKVFSHQVKEELQSYPRQLKCLETCRRSGVRARNGQEQIIAARPRPLGKSVASTSAGYLINANSQWLATYRPGTDAQAFGAPEVPSHLRHCLTWDLGLVDPAWR